MARRALFRIRERDLDDFRTSPSRKSFPEQRTLPSGLCKKRTHGRGSAEVVTRRAIFSPSSGESFAREREKKAEEARKK